MIGKAKCLPGQSRRLVRRPRESSIDIQVRQHVSRARPLGAGVGHPARAGGVGVVSGSHERMRSLQLDRRHVNDVAQQPGGARGADAIRLQQPATGAADQLGQLLLYEFDLLVDPD
jgi:hypothetical protein